MGIWMTFASCVGNGYETLNENGNGNVTDCSCDDQENRNRTSYCVCNVGNGNQTLIETFFSLEVVCDDIYCSCHL